MFALCNMMSFAFCNLKCDPEKAITLREGFYEITPAWHMNKKHWNSVSFIGDLSDHQIEQWVKDSYNLVVKSMPKKLQLELDEI
jgi:predicted DNA-binding protein (MmcQ/YjbR family)